MLPTASQTRRKDSVLAALGLCLALLATTGITHAQQLTPEQQADMLLNSARKAYQEKNYPFAAQRFREFLGRYGGHKEARSARYQLGLTLLEVPEKDYNGAVQELQQLAGANDFAEHAAVLYHLGFAKRGLGLRELEQGAAKPPEAPQRRANAERFFNEAAGHFTAAAAVFKARAGAVPENGKELPVPQEWYVRALCDQAEMLLRVSKAQEARAAVEPLLKGGLARSKYHGLVLYHYGFASFLLHDDLAAGRALSQPAALEEPVVGIHARYLLARVYHRGDERAKALLQYDTVLADYAKQKQAAGEALKRPEQFKNDPDEKARLEALIRNPPPEHVARATFYLGVLLYEDGKFADALARFTAFAKDFPQSPLLPEVQLREGFCQVQLKQYPEATRLLQPLADQQPRLADQALLWLAKAQVGAAETGNPAGLDPALKAAIETFRRAADRAQQQAGTDPDARVRRGEILFEMGDTQQLAKLFREASGTYNQVLNEKLLPEREQELLQRQATALHLAGDYAASDNLCTRFRDQFPKSALLPAVLFRYAENAYFAALVADKIPDPGTRARELARLQDEALKRYQVVIDKYPGFPHVQHARFGLAMILYRKGELEKAQQILEAIPQADRTGDLALVPYVLSDCLIRLAPARADDALAAGKMEEQLKAAAEHLEAFVGAEPTSPQAPDALLRLGLCHLRLAGLIVQPEEKAKGVAAARAAYERLIQQFPKHPLYGQAILERARCIAQVGDVNGASNELRRFTNDPVLTASRSAPMALLQLATLLRGQNKAGEAADVLARCRQLYEGALLQDAARSAWVPVLQYHQGLALREAGKLADARGVFDNLIRQFPGRPEAAEAALRRGECLKDEGLQKVDAAQKRLAGNPNPPDKAAALNQRNDGLRLVREAVQYLEGQAEQLKQKQPVPEARARMLYDAAWGYRTLADTEVADVRERMQEEQRKKLLDEAARKAPDGKPPASVSVPEVPLAQVPLQESEKRVRSLYEALIASFPDLPLAADARFELAEVLAERSEYDNAVKLLSAALDKEPAAATAEKIRLRLGACLTAKGDLKGALDQFNAVAQDPKSPLAGQANYRAGECLMQQEQWAEAVKHLALFRDQPPFQNLPGVTDKALLRLGHAYAHLKEWDLSRQAHEQVVARFGNSPWVHEARYGMGWALQNRPQPDYDGAVNVYSQVVAATATEIGARAQLQVGLCRLAQKRYPEASTALLVVPYTYDYPDLSAAALCEAARALVEMKQQHQAARLLRRVLKDHARSRWAEVARERLQAIKEG
jgi:TolA-binding protein